MDTDGGQNPSPKAPAAITGVIAANVKRLRQEARLSGPALASGLAKHGINWNRSTVAKFETGLRGSITVQELLALALVLKVSPVMLMADPRRTASVPLADGTEPLEPDAWSALLWAIGFAELDPQGGVTYRPDALVEAGLRLAHLTRTLPTWIPAAGDGSLESAARTEYIRETLEDIREAMLQITSLGAPQPPLPSEVLLAARRYDVDLPAAEV